MRKIFLLTILFFDYFHKNKIINFIKIKVKKMQTIIDVGAHHGESVELFLKNFEVMNIYSFEPSSENFRNLVANTHYLIKKKNINLECFNFGLGSCDQIVYLNIPLETSSSTINSINTLSNYYKKKVKFLGKSHRDFFQAKEKIKIRTLDKVMSNKNTGIIDLIKIDTEGYEYEVLKGSVEILKNTKLVLFEHHYDSMIIKNYTYAKINGFLILNNFKKIFKAKMPFRKTFDYIYENTRKF